MRKILKVLLGEFVFTLCSFLSFCPRSSRVTFFFSHCSIHPFKASIDCHIRVYLLSAHWISPFHLQQLPFSIFSIQPLLLLPKFLLPSNFAIEHSYLPYQSCSISVGRSTCKHTRDRRIHFNVIFAIALHDLVRVAPLLCRAAVPTFASSTCKTTNEIHADITNQNYSYAFYVFKVVSDFEFLKVGFSFSFQ